jgi:hypothetical protein
MHPRQHSLPPAIEALWLAALADAAIDPHEALLFVLDGDKDSNDFGGRHFHRHLQIYPEAEAIEIHPLLDELNDDECIDSHRIVVFTQRTIEGVGALIRHELEHARQQDVHGPRLMKLYGIAVDVISQRVHGLPGGAFLYQVIPLEMDANAAAATFVRGHFGTARIDELLRAGDGDGSAFRSLVSPPPIDGLPERMVRFFATMPDLCDRLAESNDTTFTELLDVQAWRGAGDVYKRLLGDETLNLPR